MGSSFFETKLSRQPKIFIKTGKSRFVVFVLKTFPTVFFEQEFFDHALEIFHNLLDKQEAADQDIYEKIAYCYQRKGNFKEALEYYLKAELFGTNRMWNIKKIIYCCRMLKDADKALGWCLEAVQTEEGKDDKDGEVGNQDGVIERLQTMNALEGSVEKAIDCAGSRSRKAVG